MKKYILVTETFDSLGFCLDKRLEENGDEVIIAYQFIRDDGKDENKLEPGWLKSGDNMVKKYPLEKLMNKRDKLKDWYWIFDANHNFKEGEILKEEGFKVFGGSKFTYDLENDREIGINFAESCGLYSPEFKEFKSVEEGVSFLEQNEDKAYVFKPNHEDRCFTTVPTSDEPFDANLEIRSLIKSLGFTDYILQEMVNGVEVNVESFYVKGECVFTWALLENKKNSNGELGIATGCSFDVGWKIDDNCELAEMTVRKFDDKLKEMEYTGFGDANVIISDYKDVHFLEFCFRSGYNAHCNLFINLASKSYLETCANMVDGEFETEFKQGFGASLTVFCDKYKPELPVYIPDSIKNNTYLYCVMSNENGEVLMSGYDKEICLAMGHNYDVKSSLQTALSNAKKIRFSNIYYRTDITNDDFKNNPISRYIGLKAMNLC